MRKRARGVTACLAFAVCLPGVAPPAVAEPDPLATPVQLAGGLVLGSAIAGSWVLRDRAANPPDERWSDGTVVALLSGGAVVGLGLSALAAELRPPTLGRALFTPASALTFAAATGLLVGALAGADETRAEDAYLGSAIALEAGVIAASQLGRWLDPTPRQVAFMLVGALGAAAVLGGSTAAIAGFDDDLTFAATGIGLLAGGTVGLAWSGRPR